MKFLAYVTGFQNGTISRKSILTSPVDTTNFKRGFV
jgi:hypothetical protein